MSYVSQFTESSKTDKTDKTTTDRTESRGYAGQRALWLEGDTRRGFGAVGHVLVLVLGNDYMDVLTLGKP